MYEGNSSEVEFLLPRKTEGRERKSGPDASGKDDEPSEPGGSLSVEHKEASPA